jgi:hypothetical protein
LNFQSELVPLLFPTRVNVLDESRELFIRHQLSLKALSRISLGQRAIKYLIMTKLPNGAEISRQAPKERKQSGQIATYVAARKGRDPDYSAGCGRLAVLGVLQEHNKDKCRMSD